MTVKQLFITQNDTDPSYFTAFTAIAKTHTWSAVGEAVFTATSDNGRISDTKHLLPFAQSILHALQADATRAETQRSIKFSLIQISVISVSQNLKRMQCSIRDTDDRTGSICPNKIILIYLVKNKCPKS